MASDISLTDFSANGRDLLVSYDIAAETAPAFNISVYRSSDGMTRDALVGSREIALDADRSTGAHTIEIIPDFVDVREDYRLIAVADPTGAIAETSKINNELAFAGGIFRATDGVVHLHGTAAPDSVKIDSSITGSAGASINIGIGDSILNYDASAVAEIHVRLHGDDDVLNVEPNISHNIHAFAGAGNDRILSGAGSDWLVGGAGNDFIAGRANRDLIQGDDTWRQGGDDTLLGGADNDTLEGFAGNDKLVGGRGLDITSGGDGDDIVDGGNDDDLVWSGKGRDRIVNPPGRDESRDARSEDTILATTPEELIFAELAAEEDGALEQDGDSIQESDSTEGLNWESYGFSGTVGPLWMQPVFGNTTYHPEGVGDTFWPFEILREDTAGAEVAFGIAYGGAAATADFSGQGTVLVGSTGSVAINVLDDDVLEDTEDFTAYFSDAIVPSDPGAFVIVDYPSTGQPSTDPDGDPFSATGHIVDGDLMAYDWLGPLGEVREESGAFLQVGELYPVDITLLDWPNATNDYILSYPAAISVWRDFGRTQPFPSGSAVTSLISTLWIEPVTPVTNAIVSLDWTAGWNGGMVDRVLISSVDLDLNVDSNNNGQIAADDDPIELDNPGAVVLLNNNDTNGNGVSDLQDPSPFVDGAGQPVLDDLTPMELSVLPPANLQGFDVRFTATAPGVRLWTGRDHTGEITTQTVYEIGTDVIPPVVFVEGFSAGAALQITVELRNPAGDVIALDTVTITVLLLDLDAYRAEMPYFGRDRIPENQEVTPGVGIRRNGDDDNGNGVADRFDTTVTSENDLIEIELTTAPLVQPTTGIRYVLFRGHTALNVWENSTKTTPILTTQNQVALDLDDVSETMWVEWVDMVVPDAAISLTLEAWTVSPHAAANNRLVATSTLVFYPFRSVVVALVGEQWSTGSAPITDTGVYTIAGTLRDAGYNIYFADEDEVYGRGGPDGAGPAYNSVLRSLQGHGVSQVSMFGHSHGGGSVRDLTYRLWLNQATIGPYIIPFTAYIDGIDNMTDDTFFAESELPNLTMFHTNIYQTSDLFLQGMPIVGANDNIDATNWNGGRIHDNIDNDPDVQQLIIDRLTDRVDR